MLGAYIRWSADLFGWAKKLEGKFENPMTPVMIGCIVNSVILAVLIGCAVRLVRAM